MLSQTGFPLPPSFEPEAQSQRISEKLSCRTGALRGRRSLRDGYTPSVGLPLVAS